MAQHDAIPVLPTLTKTISRWKDEINAAVITGITNEKRHRECVKPNRIIQAKNKGHARSKSTVTSVLA